jgi:hypothetical protein
MTKGTNIKDTILFLNTSTEKWTEKN